MSEEKKKDVTEEAKETKTVFQAEIDIAELADFLRFGVWSAHS